MKKWFSYLLAGLILFPFALLLMISVAKGWRFPDVLPEAWTLDHWKGLFGVEDGLGQSLLMSVGISFTVALVATISGFISSQYIAYSPNRDRWIMMAYAPFVLSPVILAACLQFYFIRAGLSGNIAGVMLGQLLIAYPFAVIVCGGHWNNQLKAMEQLVLTLGGTSRQAYWKVIIPVSQSILLVCLFQTFLISWFEYGLTTLIGVGKIQTLTLKVFQFINEANFYLAALSAWLLFLPPAILLWINKRFVFQQNL